ncbi:nucleotide exchange factor GrpE [Marinitoga sp. 38H-ov]|uniref:nucleotide exchange factor GrpE n=1 Tax=Marinitoga sp. 38H-ov TaxID=1755814 RepID=UPI0013EE3A06|nr:nucleotide exchange factor GrpE [Marinitoga sp. 38H-ov]KAF2956169.1 hypothetical protein AS160_07310 [Marinitoga sp. 38H-ov]
MPKKNIDNIENKEKELDTDMEKLMNEIEELKKQLEEEKDEKEKIKEEYEKKIEEYEKIKNYAVNLKVDFENYKDIVQKEKLRIKKEAKENIIKQILPIYKNFSIVMNNQENLDIFAKGVEMVYKSLVKTIEDIGIEFITPNKNDKFDPFEHEAIERIETDEVEEYHVFSLESPGIKLEGKILEPAKVKVAIKPIKKEDNGNDDVTNEERGE